MRRNTILLLTLAAILLFFGESQAADARTHTLIRRGVELFDAGRWSDARHELLRAQQSLTAADRPQREKVEFYLAATAVELGDKEAGDGLRDFNIRWPESVYGNDVRFSLASYYCAKGDMEAAAQAFGEVDYKALDARRREQYDIRMGYVDFTRGRYDKAYELFSRIDSGSEYADHALYYKSYIDYARGNYARAKKGFTRLAASGAYGPLAPYYLLQLEFMEGNYRYVVEKGDALAAKAAQQHRAEIERVMAESWYHLGDFNKTIHYLTLFRNDGGQMSRSEDYLMGYALYRTARYDQAEEYLRRACGPDDALSQNASYHLADCYVRRGAKREAMQSFSLAANEGYDAAIAEDALFNYGKLQYELGGGVFNEAINLLTRYLEKYPSSSRATEARQLLIAAYYNSHNYDAAYAAIKAYPNPDNDIRAALQKIAYFHGLEAFSQGDSASAKQLLDESAAVGISPKYNALALFWQGEIAYAEGDFATAEARYDAYLRRAPREAREYAFAHYNLGYSRFSQEKMADAKADFARFLALRTTADGYRSDALNRLGDTQFATRAFDEAAASYDKAVAAGGPEKYYAQYQRAVTSGLQHQVPAKIEALKRIVAAGEGDYVDDAAVELGHTYIAQEQYGDGARMLERFLSDYPSSPLRTQALSDLGLAYLNLGDKEKSLQYYDMVVAAAPRSAEAKGAMEGIRDIYVSKGDVDSYFDYAKRAGLESDVSAVSRDSLTFAAARQLYLDGEHAGAAKALSSYVERYPKGYYMADALYYLSDSYLRLDNRAAAIGSLTALAGLGANSYTATALERLASMTYADKRYDEAASAYRRLYDAARTTARRNEAMTGYVRATLAGGDGSKIAPMAADVAAQADAGTVAVRESQFALAEQLRNAADWKEAVKIYRKLGGEVKSAEGAASAFYVIKDTFDGGDMSKAEKAVFAFVDKNTPHAYWQAKAYLLLGDIYLRKGDSFQARATYQSVADGYSPADDGIVTEAKSRIAKLN